MCELKDIMSTPLPPKMEQRKASYRPTQEEAQYVYNLINEKVFDNSLKPATITIRRLRGVWGRCRGEDEIISDSGSMCEIELFPSWYCRQWFVTILAHEMVHQFQYDVMGNAFEFFGLERDMDHGPSFFSFAPRLNRFGIPLKETHNHQDWFKHQNLFLT